MARPVEIPPREQVSIKLVSELARQLDQVARDLGCSRNAAAERVLSIGLRLWPVTQLALGTCALVPTDAGVCFIAAAGPKDAGRVERTRAAWEAGQ